MYPTCPTLSLSLSPPFCLSLSLTCAHPRWRTLLSASLPAPKRWKRLCKHHITADLPFDSFQRRRQPCRVDDAGLAALAKRFLGVRSVRLVDCPLLSTKGVAVLATGHLKELTAAESYKNPYNNTAGLEVRQLRHHF